MGEYVTVSVKVKKELLDEARRLNINISELIRSALENEVRRHRLMLLEEKLKTKKSILEKIDVNMVVRLIREDRGRLDK
jgi:post-segregation antitoxin (ccd killing protein)